MILVGLDHVGASRPGRALFADLSLTVQSGDRLGIVGLNGCGKSTLLRVIAGAAEPEDGAVRRGRDVRVGLLDQRPALPAGTVRQAVGEHWEAAAILDRLGMTGLADTDVARLSGGQAKRVALARVLVHDCDLLVLDEPTNHLDIDAIAWLEDRLASFGGGLVLVTHDRHVLDRVTTRVLELDRGRAYLHDGGFQSYLAARFERDERAAEAEDVRRNLARRELAWLRRGAPARSRKPKARIEAAKAIVEGRPEQPARAGELDLRLARPAAASAPAAKGWGAGRGAAAYGTPRLGDKVVELHGVGHRWGGGPWLFEGLDLLLDPRERLGIVGANGSGKSTLLDVVARRVEPAAGTVVWGPTVRLGYYDQTGVALDPTMKVRDAVAGPTRKASWEDDRLAEQFWFDADARYAEIGTLSGGERRRLQLVLVLAERPNVVLLDEPTNDLDIDTLRVLEDFVEDWPGALVVVSHDRAFLERTVEDVVALGEGPRPRLVAGGYAAWEAARRARRGAPRSRLARSSPSTSQVPGVAAQKGSALMENFAGGEGSKRRAPSIVRKELTAAERAVARLEQRRGELVDELARVQADHRALAEAAAALAAADAELAAAEERWLALAEEAEGGAP